MTPAKGVVGRLEVGSLEVGRLEVGRRDSSVFATSPTFSSFFSTPDPEGDRRDSTVALPDYQKWKTQLFD